MTCEVNDDEGRRLDSLSRNITREIETKSPAASCLIIHSFLRTDCVLENNTGKLGVGDLISIYVVVVVLKDR